MLLQLVTCDDRVKHTGLGMKVISTGRYRYTYVTYNYMFYSGYVGCYISVDIRFV